MADKTCTALFDFQGEGGRELFIGSPVERGLFSIWRSAPDGRIQARDEEPADFGHRLTPLCRVQLCPSALGANIIWFYVAGVSPVLLAFLHQPYFCAGKEQLSFKQGDAINLRRLPPGEGWGLGEFDGKVCASGHAFSQGSDVLPVAADVK